MQQESCASSTGVDDGISDAIYHNTFQQLKCGSCLIAQKVSVERASGIISMIRGSRQQCCAAPDETQICGGLLLVVSERDRVTSSPVM